MDKNNRQVVLLAEDDAEVRHYLAGLLSEGGYSVIEAEDGRDACAKYRDYEEVIDCLVVDMRMPNMGGGELAEFNYNNRFFPFVVCTAVADAQTGLGLLQYGVHDYVVKPVDKAVLVGAVYNAIRRRMLSRAVAEEEDPFAGNIGTITIDTRQAELKRTARWISRKLESRIEERSLRVFMTYFTEMLVNAYEHGNLRISEEEKRKLIVEGKYDLELESRESNCKGKIRIEVSLVLGEIAVNITDDGPGFPFEKFLNISRNELLDRLELPSGRGIYMASKWFDTISFSKGGASVLFVKKFPPKDLLA